MSWLNQSLSGLKGQFKTLANEVFSEGIVEDSDPFTELNGANRKINELKNLCASQDVEIKTLRRQNATLHQERLNALAAKKNGHSSKAPSDSKTADDDESSWFWDPPDGESSSDQVTENLDAQRLLLQIHSLEAEISNLKANQNESGIIKQLKGELEVLRDENKNLTLNLEDLDNQNQQAVNRVIALKKDLQANYETLQQKYESLEKENSEFKTRLKRTEEDREATFKEMTDTNLKLISDLDTLHHKYENLEKVHRLLTENTEKFQEENVELSEENFRLQEECTRLQNDVEEMQKKHQQPPHVKSNENHVPNEKYRELEHKFLELERKFAETVTPKSVDSVMNAIHDSNAQEMIAKLKFEIVELQNKLNTNEEIKRLNLEIDHLKKEVDALTIQKDKHDESIICDSIKTLLDKYITFEVPDIQKPFKTVPDDLIKYTDVCLKLFVDARRKNETLEIRVAEDSRVINNLQSNIDEMNAEMDILNGDLAQYEHECSELKKNNDFLIAEIGALKSVSKLEPILEHNEEHLEKLQTELDDCSNLNKSFEAELEKNEQHLKNVQSERDRLKREIELLKEELNGARQDLVNVRKTQQECEEETQQTATLERKLYVAQDELEKTRSQLHSVTVDNEKSKIDLTILDNDKILLLREISDLKGNLHAKSIIEDYAKKVEAEKTDLEMKLCRMDEMESDLENIRRENEALKVKINDFDALSDYRANLVNDELTLHKKNEAEVTQLLSQKEIELQKVVSKVLALESKLEEAVDDRNKVCKKLTEILRLDIPSPKDNHENLQIDKLVDAVKEELDAREQKCTTINDELAKLYEEVAKTKTVNENLNILIQKSNDSMENLKSEFNQCQKMLDIKVSEFDTLTDKVNLLNNHVLDSKQTQIETITMKDREIELRNTEVLELKELLSKSNADLCAMTEQSNIDSQKLIDAKVSLNDNIMKMEIKDKQILILNENIIKIQKELDTIAAQNERLSEENKENFNADDLESLKATLESAEKENAALERRLEEVIKDNSKIEQLERFKMEALQQLDQMNAEKGELINLVTQKHQESITYHAEIQRLNAVIFTENERYRELERIYAETRDKQISQEHASPEEVSRLNQALKERTDRCAQLERALEDYKMTGVTAEELESLKEKNQFLLEKCDVLAKNLVTEQGNVKQITQEKMQIAEREHTVSKEVERLRQHLAESSEEHTRELVAAEQRCQEAQNRLLAAEEKVKHSSTLYTSNSIRANQEVETLRMQIRLVEKQRDEIQSQLSQSEDRNSKHVASLTNLQCVLEQFQLDKEREGDCIAGRARREVEEARSEAESLRRQVAGLEERLRDSSSGLRAASRLSAQLDARTAQAHEAREQAVKLEAEISQWKQKYRDAISNQQDKVDKSLVKNLLMGYIHTVNNQKQGDRLQVLRLLSTVLDFDQWECARAGLGGRSAGAVPASGGDSLAQEFIRFLERESRPRLNVGLPNLLHLGQTQGPNSPSQTMQKSSGTNTPQPTTADSPQRLVSSSPSPAGQPAIPLTPMAASLSPMVASVSPMATSVSPMMAVPPDRMDPVAMVGFNNSLAGGFSLFTRIANPDIAVNQTRNSEGAILKNVLKDT